MQADVRMNSFYFFVGYVHVFLYVCIHVCVHMHIHVYMCECRGQMMTFVCLFFITPHLYFLGGAWSATGPGAHRFR